MIAKTLGLIATAHLICAPATAQDITVTPLADISSNAVGLVSASNAGLPAGFWADTSATLISDLIHNQRHHKIPEARAYLNRLIVTELIPPRQDGVNVDMILARIDWLMANGAVDAADALMNKAGVTHPEMFKRWFDAKLMLGHPQQACTPLQQNPSLGTELATKVYCLAQNGDWFSAELTLVSGRNLGAIDADMADLLSIFLEPELIEETTARDVKNTADPLEFAIREALALPRPASGITLAQSHVDLDDAAGWLAQLRAGEDLARVGAIPPQYLQALYTRNAKASASGGVWERVKAGTKLNRAIADADPDAACVALRNAWHEMRNAQLLHIFAALYATPLASMEMPDGCNELQTNTVLLHPNYGTLLFDIMELIPETDILRSITTDNFQTAKANSEIETAIIDAFAQDRISLISPAQSILSALHDIKTGIESDPRRIRHAIATLLNAGFTAEAQRMALQLVILERNR